MKNPNEAPQDLFPQLAVPCEGCGAQWGMPGRWAEVAKRLPESIDVHLFLRCNQCHSMLYTPELDIMTGKMDFFQVVLRPDNSQEMFQMVTYDVGGWAAAAKGGVDTPDTGLVDLAGKKYQGVPAEDLLCGVCAKEKMLHFKDVRDCVRAVRRAFPAQPKNPVLLS